MDLSQKQLAEILKYFLIGLSGGAALNTTLNLASYLNDKNKDAKDSEALNDSIKRGPVTYEVDPDELKFINNKKASFSKTADSDSNNDFLSSSIARALTILALAGGGYGGYKLSDSLNDAIKANETEEQAKTEKENYYKNLYLLSKAKQLKRASVETKPFKKVAVALSDILGTGLGLLLLTALGSAWASREFMKKQYPKLNINKALSDDKNILLQNTPEIPIFVEKKREENSKQDSLKLNESVALDSDTPKNLGADKNESYIGDDPFSKLEKFSFAKQASYINESLLRLCYEFEQAGKQGSVTNLVKVASEGLITPLKQSIQQYNPELTIFDIADKLSEKFTKSAYSKEKEQLALTWLASSPEISAAIMPQVAAEFLDHAPVISKIATELHPNEHLFSGLLTAATIQSRIHTFKKLSSVIDAEDKLKKMAAYEAAPSEDEFVSALESILQSSLPLVETISKSLN